MLKKLVRPCKGMLVLEINAPRTASLLLPPFLQIEKEVTDIPQYATYQMALNNNQQQQQQQQRQ
jgi:hypothetical protein